MVRTGEPCVAVAARPGVVDVLVQRLATKHLKCMAFAAQGDVATFDFYAVEAPTQSVLLVELQVSKTTGQASAVVKGPNPATVPPFSALLLPSSCPSLQGGGGRPVGRPGEIRGSICRVYV